MAGPIPEGTEVLEGGALNPVISTRMDKLPWLAIIRAAETMKHGMKYEVLTPDNWRGVPAEEHLNHALRHIALHQAGNGDEDHVGHAVSRILMWGDLLCRKT